MPNEDFNLDTQADILLMTEIFKSLSRDEKDRFLNSQDGQVFFRKIRFSPLYKGLPSTTARLVDMLAGTANEGYYDSEDKLSETSEAPSGFQDKRIASNLVENSIQASINDPIEYWVRGSDLMRVFKASAASIEASLHEALEDGRISKGFYNNEIVYASC